VPSTSRQSGVESVISRTGDMSPTTALTTELTTPNTLRTLPASGTGSSAIGICIDNYTCTLWFINTCHLMFGCNSVKSRLIFIIFVSI